MTKQKRASSFLDPYFKTPQNLREFAIADDPLYEPEDASFIRGYIGSSDLLTSEDLSRVPLITENDATRDAYQLSVATAVINPTSGEYDYAAFYTDLVNQIATNGGLTDNPNRLFETNYYAWTPPIDYDKHVNYSSYYWIGPGNAEENGEYTTREVSGSQTVVYQYDGTEMVKKAVSYQHGHTSGLGAIGDLIEDVDDANRTLYAWNGTSWYPISYTVVDSLPSDLSGLSTGDYFYVARTGPNYQRPLIQMYSTSAGRWIAQPVVIDSKEPEYPINGMIWEDCRIASKRRLRRFTGYTWIDLDYTSSSLITGIGTDGQYVYDISLLSASDSWARQNWWRHYEDLSQYDRSQLIPGDQAIRPILEFWNSIEMFPSDQRTDRNQSPRFREFNIDPLSYNIVSTGSPNTIMEYQHGTGRVDPVLKFIPAYDSSGEFIFDMTLDMETSSSGYKFYRDRRTGLFHSIWEKAPDQTRQNLITGTDDLYEIPKNLASNPNHAIPLSVSRANILTHIRSILRSQEDFFGNDNGRNSYRWTKKNPFLGATIIDPEHSLLRIMATLQTPDLDIPDAIRYTGREYTRILSRFSNRLNQLWNQLALNDPTGRLTVSLTHAVDSVLTLMFLGKSDSSEYSLSDMGTYVETRSFNGTATVIGTGPLPIYIPSSSARLGLSSSYVPGKFQDQDKKWRLRGHDGVSIESFGDDRDLVWLELQNRFFAAIPENRKLETETYSTRHISDEMQLGDYYGGYSPVLAVQSPVLAVVDNHLDLSSPAIGVYLSRNGFVYAHWDGTIWGTTPVQFDDAVLNQQDSNYYIFNGYDFVLIPTWTNGHFDYTTNEYRRIIRRDFERWTNENGLDHTLNTDFDPDNKFTWNYSSVGIEGNYRGIYRRVYRTIRPDARPWEIVGYHIEPTWWRTEYVPTSIAEDGFPRYSSHHPMWAQLAQGIVHPPLNLVRPELAMIAPIPVDEDGELLDPISAGLVEEDKLDKTRLDLGWVYGDGGPVEVQFWASPNFTFAQAMAGYLMKPAIWLDTYWIDGYLRIGRDTIWHGSSLIHSLTRTRPAMGAIPLHMSLDASGNRVAQHGVQEWIVERIYKLGKDPIGDFSNIITNTSPILAWKTAGFIDDKRTTITTLSGSELPFEDLHVVLHQSKPFREEFCSGMMITREDTGFRIYGFDSATPFFLVDMPARSTFGGQVELREQVTLNKDQYRIILEELTLPQSISSSDTARLAVLFKGLRLNPDFYQVVDSKTLLLDSSFTISGGEILEIVVLTTISNPSTQMRTFSVGSVQYSYFASGTGRIEEVPYGTFFENPNEVINFMLGYGRYLTSRGWVFDTTEPTTGSMMDWLHGAKAFATWIQKMNNLDEIKNTSIYTDDFDTFFYSPIRYRAHFQSSFGQALNVESIKNGIFGLISKRGEAMSLEGVTVTNLDGEIEIIPGTTFALDGDNQLYGARVYLVENQHVVLFSNKTKFNQVVYDPLYALYHKTLYVDTYRSNSWQGRMDAAGFIIEKGALLPNFEKQVFDITRYYSRINPTNDRTKNEQAQNLLGYYPLDTYMDQVLADQRTSFDYYRGMIKAKGTVRAVKAFSRGTTMGPDNVLIQEDWAWKLAEFGDLRRTLVQFSLGKASLQTPVQVIRFGVEVDPESLYVEVPDLDRNSSSETTPWILPPVPSQNGISQMRFPITAENVIDYSKYKYRANLFDTNSNLVSSDTFVYDPANGFYEPLAYAQIDYLSFYDPARYAFGDKAAYSNDLYWGPQQVGQQWFTSNVVAYLDYTRLIPDYDSLRKFWGKQLYFNGDISRSGNLVTITTRDFLTGEVVPHGTPIGGENLIRISGADQTDYNQNEQYVTAISTTQYQYKTNQVPDSPATGNIRIDVSWIWVYEWVESPVPPEQWTSYTAGITTANAPGGVPMYYGHPTKKTSYTRIDDLDQNGNSRTRYYFWVRNNPGPSPLGRQFSSLEIENRLSDPTGEGLPWIAPVDAQTLLLFLADQTLTNTSALEVSVDGRSEDTHVEWALITEGSHIRIPPPRVWDKVANSIAGIDAQGNAVPYPGFAASERFGTKFFPPQTVFPDRQAAFEVWKSIVNRIFSSRDFSTDFVLVERFQLADEYSTSNPTGYWVRAAYLDQTYAGKTPVDIVGTIEERDYRYTQGFYMDGDLVEVINSIHRDPWTNLTTATTYVYQDQGTATEIGSANSTVQIVDSLYSESVNFLQVFNDVRELFTPEENSEVLIGLIHEMLRQTQSCDWCFKTSYITAHVFDDLRQDAFVHPNQIEAIYNNIIDTKPYRTKFRAKTITFSLQHTEDANVTIEDTNTDKITLLFDRLSSSTFDDHGYDTHGIEVWPWGYDRSLWELNDFGRGEYILVGTFNGDNVTKSFSISPPYDPNLYGVIGKFFITGIEQDIATTGNSYQIMVRGKTYYVEFAQALLTGQSLNVYMNIGFVQGNRPILGNGLDDQFLVTECTYEHLTARLIKARRGAELGELRGIDLSDPLGGHTEERVRTESSDGLLIGVVMDYSPVMAGYDCSPYDSTPFDSPPPDIGERVFFHGAGAVQVDPPGILILVTSEDITAGSSVYISGSYNYHIDHVRISSGGPFSDLVEGVDYERVSGFPYMIKLTTPQPGSTIRYVYNGWNVGALGSYRVISIPTDYDITNGLLTLSSTREQTFISLSYNQSRYRQTPLGLLTRNSVIVDDLMPDHLVYDNAGFETNRPIGTVHLNTTNSNIYRWNGTAWVLLSTAAYGQKVFVKRLGQIWLNNNPWVQEYQYGDSYGDPVFEYPSYGKGIISGTYVLGQLSDASTTFPEAYAVVQNSGGTSGP